MALTRRSRRWLIAAGVALVVIAAGGLIAWRLLFNDSTRALGVDEALERYRASTSVASTTTTEAVTEAPTSTAPTASTLPPTSLPTPGVYVYATVGQESVDALTGALHTYPAETTITVVPGGCGVRLRWAPLVERYEEWDLCQAPDGGLATTGYTSVHTFFGQNQIEHYTCPPGTVYLPHPGPPGTTWTTPCRLDDIEDTTVWTVVGMEPIAVGPTVVPAVHVHGADVSTDPDGSTSRTTIDLWLRSSDGLTLQRSETGASVNKTIVGDVHYQEHIELRLLDLQPRH